MLQSSDVTVTSCFSKITSIYLSICKLPSYVLNDYLLTNIHIVFRIYASELT